MTQRNSAERVGEDMVRAVARGELPLSALVDAGVIYEVAAHPRGGREISVRQEAPMTVDLRPVDIAHGLLTYRGQPQALQEWATFLQCADIIDLASFESSQQGDELLNALWDASFEARITSASLAVANSLVAQ